MKTYNSSTYADYNIAEMKLFSVIIFTALKAEVLQFE